MPAKVEALTDQYFTQQKDTISKDDLQGIASAMDTRLGNVSDTIVQLSARLVKIEELDERLNRIEKRDFRLKPKHSRSHLNSPRANSLRNLAIAVSVATLLATVISAWSAYETRRSANEARKAADVQIWFYLSSRYASREMFASMKKLRAYQQHNPKTFEAKFKANLVNIDKLRPEERRNVEDVDAARRLVSDFCGTLMVLDREGLMARRVIKNTWANALYDYLIQVLDPLEQAKAESICAIAPCSQARLDSMKQDRQIRLQFFDPKLY